MKRTKIRNRLLFCSCLACGMLMSGCSDSDYDISSVDAKLGVGSNLSLPSDNSVNIMLDDILDLGSTDLIKVLGNGDYQFGKDPETVSDVNVNVEKITLAEKTETGLSFDITLPEFPTVITGMQVELPYSFGGQDFDIDEALAMVKGIDDYQYIRKWGNSRNVPILRRQMVYWRMAEALNQAGYPRMAFLILSTGINNQVIRNEVEPYYAESDTLFLRRFDFPAGNDRYSIYDVEKMLGLNTQPGNTMGMHSRGSGWTPLNEYYQLPNDTIEFDDVLRQQLIAEQQQYVDSLLIVENALEFAFEGTRFYDLMRFALRSSNPGQYMADHIYARRGKTNAAEVAAEVAAVSDPRNWYLSWKGQIGMK